MPLQSLQAFSRIAAGGGNCSEMIGFGYGTDGIDGRSHGQRLTSGVSQAEIYGGTSAVGWWRGWIIAGSGPEPAYIGDHLR